MQAIVELGYVKERGADGASCTYVWVAKWLNRGRCLRAYGVDGGGTCMEVRATTARTAVNSMMIGIRSLLPDIQVVLLDAEAQTVEDLFSSHTAGTPLTWPAGETDCVQSRDPGRSAGAIDIVELPPAGQQRSHKSAKPSAGERAR